LGEVLIDSFEVVGGHIGAHHREAARARGQPAADDIRAMAAFRFDLPIRGVLED
jgi:hypothetical protein